MPRRSIQHVVDVEIALAERPGAAQRIVDYAHDFLRVPLAALVGWLVYAERVDIFTMLGAALILAGNLLNLKGTRSS